MAETGSETDMPSDMTYTEALAGTLARLSVVESKLNGEMGHMRSDIGDIKRSVEKMADKLDNVSLFCESVRADRDKVQGQFQATDGRLGRLWTMFWANVAVVIGMAIKIIADAVRLP